MIQWNVELIAHYKVRVHRTFPFFSIISYDKHVYWNEKVASLYGSTLPKTRITSTNAPNKNSWALNFAQESVGAYVCLPYRKTDSLDGQTV